MRATCVLCCLAATAVVGSTFAQSQVWTVDDSGGADFTTIAAAVAQASPGDLVLVRAGNYAGFALDKGLSIVADSGAQVRVVGQVTLSGVNEGPLALLRGLKLEGAGSDRRALLVKNGSGHVWAEDLVVRAASTPGNALPGADAVVVDNAGFATFVHATLEGGATLVNGSVLSNGGRGASVRNSQVQFFASTVRGGYGLDGHLWAGGGALTGWSGLECDSSTVLVSAGAVIGGQGGHGGGAPCVPDANGATGLVLIGFNATAIVADGALTGGAAGADPLLGASPCGAAVSGPASHVFQGAIDAWNGDVAELVAPAVVREGESLLLQATAQPGSVCVLAYGGVAGTSLFEPWSGAFGVGFPVQTLLLGTASAAGSASKSVLVPELGAGVEFARLHAQVVTLSPQGSIVLGTPTAITLLDAGI